MPFHAYSFKRFNTKVIKSKGSLLREDEPDHVIRAREDFAFFRQYVCDHSSPRHHLDWTRIINTSTNSKCLVGIGGPHTLILAPRGSAKSTWSVEWTAYQIGRHTAPDIRLPIKVLYVSYSIEIALGKSEQIKSILESPKYQEVFPWVRPGKKWGDRLWDIDKAHANLPLIGEPYTLACAGMKGAVASRRSHLTVMDDLIKSPEQVDNPAVREKMSANWSNVIRPTMYEGSRAICIGTRMHFDDIYATTFTKEAGWEIVEESAIAEDEFGEEVSYWEEMHSLAYLQGLRKDDPIAFSLQYQNQIPKEGEGIISPDWWVEGNPPPLEEMDSIVIGSDFSASQKETADFTVFLLIGRKDDTYWILDMRRGRWSGNIDKCNVLVGLLLDWGIVETDDPYKVDFHRGTFTWLVEKPKVRQTGFYVTFFAESKSYQVSFQSDYIRHVQGELGIFNVTCIPLDLKGDKVQKLRGITGLLQRKQVICNKYMRNRKRIRQELVSFGFTKLDDIPDALVLGLTGLGARPPLDVG